MNSYDSLLLFLFKSMKFHVSKLFSKEEQKTSHNFGHFSPSPLPEVEHADPELLLGDSTVAVSVKRPGGVRAWKSQKQGQHEEESPKSYLNFLHGVADPHLVREG